MEFGSIRKEYFSAPLRKFDLEINPFSQFEKWYQQATEAKIIEANAMSLATVNENGAPSSRMVLLKIFDERGFVFFTDRSSRKAHEIAANPKAALLFFWRELERQVSIEGLIEKVAKKEAENYFKTRPRDSQIATWASKQGKFLKNREELEKQFQFYQKKFFKKQIPVPPNWQGYRLVPLKFEFWQGRINRLHDRFLYLKDEEQWKIERISP